MSIAWGQTYGNLINGEWVQSASGRTAPSTNPANRHEVVGRIQLSVRQDLDDAVAAAKQALPAWRSLTGPARGDYLFRAAAALERRLDEIAETMTREMGKTLPEAKGETMRGVALLRYYAGEGMRRTGDVIPSAEADAFMYTTRVPLGVVGVITPWNFPVAIPVWKLAPALVYGNTVVLKPATESAVTAAKVAECFQEAGFPAGVLNLVTGPGSVIGQGIAEHPDIQGVTFTGSDAVGRAVAEAAVRRGVKYQLEMGGKNPVIVAEDADLDQAVEATVSGAFRSTGQKCTATSRVIVHRKVHGAFREKLLARIREIAVGDGMQPGIWMGPCSSEQQMETVLRYIDQGIREGAKLIAGGRRLREGVYEAGFYVEPTVFDEVDSKMAIAQEEIFGPVIALIPADDLRQAVEIANDTKFGLSASVFTKNIGAAMEFIKGIDAGMVRVNAETAGVELQAPFGGMKQSSSHSREQGPAAIEFFTEIKTVLIKP